MGYSFSDFDFLKIHKILTSEMKGMRPHSYLVTLDEKAGDRLKGLSVTPIITTGAYFLVRIKEHLVKENQLIPDELFEGLDQIYASVADAHDKISKIRLLQYPTVMLTACYQDGLMHALERTMSQKHTGEYSNASSIFSKL